MGLLINITGILDKISAVNEAVNGFVWGTPLLILLVGTGVYLTFRLRLFQITKAKYIYKATVGSLFSKNSEARKSGKESISQLQAVSTILAATLGTGNITGVATAITAGGPGAVFWMWISAFFGMMTMYAEAVLAIYFRKKNKAGEWTGGTMYSLENGLKTKSKAKFLAKPLGVLFAVLCVIASFGIGNMTQSNSISNAMKTNFGIPLAVSGFAVARRDWIFGGLRNRRRSRKNNPSCLPFYTGLLVYHFRNLIVCSTPLMRCFQMPFRSVAGGVGGYAVSRAVSFGLRRGVYSNEAGLGSSATVQASSDTAEPVIQGMWGIFAVFVDTILICSLTAFAVLSVKITALPVEAAAENITDKPSLVVLSTSSEVFERDAAKIPLILKKPLDEADINQSFEGMTGKAYGRTVKIKASRDLFSAIAYNRYINVAVLRGVPRTDAKGMKILDDKGNPIIEYAEVAPIGGVNLVSVAFSSSLGSAAGKVIAISILLFAFATLLGWAHIGSKALEYLLKEKGVTAYKFIFTLFFVLGAVANLELAEHFRHIQRTYGSA